MFLPCVPASRGTRLNWTELLVQSASSSGGSRRILAADHSTTWRDECKTEPPRVQQAAYEIAGPKSPNGVDEHGALGHHKIDLVRCREGVTDDCETHDGVIVVRR